MEGKRGRPRKRERHNWRDIETQQLVVDFHTKRLAEAQELLAKIVANGGKRP